MDDKKRQFCLKYDILDDDNKNISYTKCVRYIQHCLYYNQEEQYVNFLTEFHKFENVDLKKIVPPKLNFKKLRSGNTSELTLGEIRKYKIDEFLKNTNNNNETEEEI